MATDSPDLTLPPGLLFNGAVVVMFVVAVWRGSERTGQLGSILLVGLVWFVLLLAWLFRFVGGAGSGTVMGPRRRAPIRWGLAPALFVVAAVVVFGGHAFDARFGLSRPALERAATDAVAGHAPRAGWIGLYPVRSVTVESGSVRIEVDGQQAFVRDAPTVTDDSPSVWYVPIDRQWSLEQSFED